MATTVDQAQMLRAACIQAQERADREKAPMYVYERSSVWFVRSAGEGQPWGSIHKATRFPDSK